MATEPTKITIRMFVVGFGDCFLLTFHYDPPLKDQSILIDFGTASGNADMKGIANEIRKACNGKLYAVVATHRHKDHISGFSDKAGKDSPGAIIASCKPEIVIQPWTENPKAGAKATSAALLSTSQPKKAAQVYFASLNSMQAYAQAVVDQAPQWRGAGGRPTVWKSSQATIQRTLTRCGILRRWAASRRVSSHTIHRPDSKMRSCCLA